MAAKSASVKSASAKMTLKVSSFILRLLLNIVFYVLAVILIIYCSKAAHKFAYQIYGPVTVDPKPGREIIIQIKKGDTNMDIASKLELNRAVINKYSFFFKTKLGNYVIMPGTYSINSSMTYDEILDTITDYSASIIQNEDPAKPKDGKGTGSTTDGTGKNSGNEALTQPNKDAGAAADKNSANKENTTNTNGGKSTNKP